jgi:hypothetical protein
MILYYKPIQNPINFVYDHVKNVVGIYAKVTVFLKPKDALTRIRVDYDAVTNKAEKEFTHSTGTSTQDPVEFTDDSWIIIIDDPKKIPPYDQHDPEAFKKALRVILALKYEIKSSVREIPGVSGTGGQTTNTISNTAEIVIV